MIGEILLHSRLARFGDTDRAIHWYEQFTEDWKDADPDIPELIEAREKLAKMKEAGVAVQ